MNSPHNDQVVAFLLLRPATTRADGFTTTHTPFMIESEGKQVYAAFGTVDMAWHFARAVGLDADYEAVPLHSVDQNMLREADEALLVNSLAQVRQLLAGKLTGTAFGRSLIRIRRSRPLRGSSAEHQPNAADDTT